MVGQNWKAPQKLVQCRILVVNNEPVVTGAGERYLLSEGFAVSTYEDGEEALSLARDWKSDLVGELIRVLDRFYRSNRARRREKAGGGLGLTIVKGSLSCPVAKAGRAASWVEARRSFLLFRGPRRSQMVANPSPVRSLISIRERR